MANNKKNINIDFNVSPIFRRLQKMIEQPNKRYIALYGGTSSTKTISILQYLVVYCLQNPDKDVNIISKTMAKAKKQLIPEMKKIVMKNLWEHITFNKQESLITFPNNASIRMISADEPEKIIGLRSDILYADEINTINKNVMDELEVRTRYKIIASWNPTAMFSWYKKNSVKEKFIEDKSNYKDNPFLEQEIIDDIEDRARRNPNFKKIHIDMNWGTSTGVIFEEGIHWEIVDSKPLKEIKQTIFGVDYGYIDPTTLTKLEIFTDKSIFLSELTYKSKLKPTEIIQQFKNQLDTSDEVVSEFASGGKAINEEMFNDGYNFHDVSKTPLMDGISKMYDYKYYIDKNSINLIDEFRNYKWKVNKNGETMEIPIDAYNHCIDGIRYAQTKINEETYVSVFKKKR